MTAVLLTPLFESMLDANGNPLVGGFIYSYQAGTSTPLATYTDATGTTPAANPIVLDSAGRPAGGVWGAGVYKFILKDSLGNTIDTVDNVTAIYGSGDMLKSTYDQANIAQQIVGTTAVQTVSNKTLTGIGSATFNAGTTSISPLTLTSGINLTTATAGAIEYNGYAPMFTPLGTQRGVIDSSQLFVLNSDLAGANVNTAQSIFGVSVNLAGSVAYEFDGMYIFTKSAGASAHTVSILWNSASVTRIGYVADIGANTTALTTTAALNRAYAETSGTLGLTGSISSATSNITVRVRGTIVPNGNITLTPQYILSAAPGGAYSTKQGSYFKIWPVAAGGSNINIGTWS